eukprot:3381732-Prymnesium_polylepis.1
MRARRRTRTTRRARPCAARSRHRRAARRCARPGWPPPVARRRAAHHIGPRGAMASTAAVRPRAWPVGVRAPRCSSARQPLGRRRAARSSTAARARR